MSYLNRMQEYRRNLESGQSDVPPSVQMSNLPPDQTENIFNDNMNVMRDQMLQKATAPFTAVGSADLVRRGFNKIPAIQDIKDAYQKSGEFADKLKGILKNNDLQSFLDDPESAIKTFTDPIKQKVLDAVNEGIDKVKAQGLDTIGEAGQKAQDLGNVVGDKISTLSDSIPTSDEAAALTQKITSAAGQGLGEGIQKGLFGNQANPVQEAPEEEAFNRDFQANLDADGEGAPVEAEVDPEEAFNREFQASLDADGEGPQNSHPAQAGQVEAEAEAEEAPGEPRDFMGELKDGASDLNDALGKSNAEAFKSLLDRDNVGESSQSGATQAQPESAVGQDAASGAENLERAKVATNIKTSDGLTDALDKTNAADVDTGADSMNDVLGNVAGDEAPELAAGLGVADFIPGIGTLFDAGSIAAIAAESIDFYNNKAKEAKAQSVEAARQTQIQKDISEEQSTLVQQGRDEATQQDQGRQVQAQASNPLPVSQSGTDLN